MSSTECSCGNTGVLHLVGTLFVVCRGSSTGRCLDLSVAMVPSIDGFADALATLNS